MKKAISLILALVLFAMPVAVASAADNDQPADVYKVTVIQETKEYVLEPLDGYEYYVADGNEFKFTISAKNRYSDEFIVVYYYPTNLYRDNDTYQTPVIADTDGVYTISDIHADITIDIYGTVKEKSEGPFSFVRNLIQMIISFFKNIANIFKK
ncbi:MAG: hypothetical protein IJ766_06405 [Clostridia bacterium]|nr:hypothetical protein [Clostridia bacterium]